MNNQVILTTKRLIIRKFNLDDINKVYQMSKEKGIKRWLPDQVYKSKEETEEILKYLKSRYRYIPDMNNFPYVFGLELKEGNDLVGHIGLSKIELGIEVGYAIADRYANQGYATEVVTKFSNWTLVNFKLDKLWGIVDQINIASINVLEKSNYALKDKSKGKYRYVYE